MDQIDRIAHPAPGRMNFAGLPLYAVDVEGVHEFIRSTIERGEKALVLNLNIHAANCAFTMPWYREFLQTSQLVFCDGDGIRWGCKWLGLEVPPKITYDRWIWQVGEFCRERGYRLYFLGSKPGVAQTAAGRLEEAFPGIQIVGTAHGYFQKTGEENRKIIADINRARPDILIVGFGMPLQEAWLREHWRELDAHVFLNGGAVFDCASGRLKSPPAWVIRGQIEWLYRLSGQPVRRFKRYALGIPYFFLRLALTKGLGRRPGTRESTGAGAQARRTAATSDSPSAAEGADTAQRP